MSGATVTREARTLTGVTECGIGETDLQPVAAKEQVSQVRHHPDGAVGQGTSTSGQFSRWGPAQPAGGGRSRVSPPTGMVPVSALSPSQEGGVPVPGRASAQSALRRSPRFAGRCRPEVGPVLPVGAPLPARRSAWWHGRHTRHVQRPRGAFCDSASAPEYEKCGLAPATPGRPDRYRRRWVSASLSIRLPIGVKETTTEKTNAPAAVNAASV